MMQYLVKLEIRGYDALCDQHCHLIVKLALVLNIKCVKLVLVLNIKCVKLVLVLNIKCVKLVLVLY